MLAIEVLKELERWYRESNGAFAPKGTSMYDDERTWHDVVEEALAEAGELPYGYPTGTIGAETR